MISSAWVVWPLFCTTKTYFPGLKEVFESLMWKSVSTALTVVAFEAAEAVPDVKTVAAPVAAASAASAAAASVARRVIVCRVACVVVLCGRRCDGLTPEGTGRMESGIEPVLRQKALTSSATPRPVSHGANGAGPKRARRPLCAPGVPGISW